MYLFNLLFIDWQPSKEAFTVLGRPVLWYGILWIVGLALSVVVISRLYKKTGIPEEKFDPLIIYGFFSILIGSRLGHCLFYEPDYYLSSKIHFIEMFIPFRYETDPLTGASHWVMEGYRGLASHGGTIGLFIGLLLYVRKYKLSFLKVLDIIAIATPITACCIRLGNLMNSEIIGSPTDKPWGFIFHTYDALVNGQLAPRHPAQLYEAIAYFVFFLIGLLLYSKFKKKVGTGFFFGFCLTAIFIFRFFIEFLKEDQVDFESSMTFNMGQLLSIPFIIVGLYCMIGSKWQKQLQAKEEQREIEGNKQKKNKKK